MDNTTHSLSRVDEMKAIQLAAMMNRMITMPICREISTAVQQDSWGRIKASIRGDLQWLDALRFGLR
jgi:hypothetical protein